MAPSVLIILALAAVASLLLPAAASAESTAGADFDRIIVLQSQVGSPPLGAGDELTSLLQEQLEAEGFAARPSTIARLLGGRLPRPGVLDRGLTAADIIHPIELGYDDWAHGQFVEAEKKLTSALQKIRRNPALLVTDTKNLDATFKGLVALALSQAKLGNTSQSTETMLELIRVFGARPLSRAEYGPPAEQLYRTVSRQALAGGRGQLFVTTGNDHAVIFVDGQIRGVGKVAVGDLIPGAHRVFVQVPSTVGRQYEVEIKANEAANLDAVWEVDMSLAVTELWIGLVFATEAERSKEALVAGELARRWGGQGMVVVISTLQLQGKPFLIGTVYRAGGEMLRSAATSLDGDRRALLRSLARYLADGTVSPGLNVIAGDRHAAPPAVALRRSVRRSAWASKGIAGAGALAVLVGGTVYGLSEADDFTRPTYDDRRTPAVGVAIGGSMVLGAGLGLWLREARSASPLTAALLGTGVSAIFAGGTLVLTDEDLHTSPDRWHRERYRDTAVAGGIVGATGIVVTSVGLWLLHREGPRASGALASTRSVVLPGGALVGWSHAF